MKPTILPTLLVTAGLGLSAQPMPAPPRLATVLRQLEFSDAQRTALLGIFAQHKDALMVKSAAFRDARRAEVDAALDPATTEDSLRALHAQTSETFFQLMLETRAITLDGRSVLTAGQQAQLKSLLSEGRARMDGLRTFAFGR
ncbi:MAG: Spy/CpxP family protein refolding chaperone [Holophagaceae bacterium]|nr:Spy/CpxP family protein refolding chaperone [Holophagaceae bacterium]